MKNKDSNKNLTDLTCLMDALKTESINTIISKYNTNDMKDNKLLQVFKNLIYNTTHFFINKTKYSNDDQLLFQFGYEHGDDSPISKQADTLLQSNRINFPWFKQTNRKKKFLQNPNIKTIYGSYQTILHRSKELIWFLSYDLEIFIINIETEERITIGTLPSQSRKRGVSNYRVINKTESSKIIFYNKISIGHASDVIAHVCILDVDQRSLDILEHNYTSTFYVEVFGKNKMLSWDDSELLLWDLNTFKSKVLKFQNIDFDFTNCRAQLIKVSGDLKYLIISARIGKNKNNLIIYNLDTDTSSKIDCRLAIFGNKSIDPVNSSTSIQVNFDIINNTVVFWFNIFSNKICSYNLVNCKEEVLLAHKGNISEVRVINKYIIAWSSSKLFAGSREYSNSDYVYYPDHFFQNNGLSLPSASSAVKGSDEKIELSVIDIDRLDNSEYKNNKEYLLSDTIVKKLFTHDSIDIPYGIINNINDNSGRHRVERRTQILENELFWVSETPVYPWNNELSSGFSPVQSQITIHCINLSNNEHKEISIKHPDITFFNPFDIRVRILSHKQAIIYYKNSFLLINLLKNTSKLYEGHLNPIKVVAVLGYEDYIWSFCEKSIRIWDSKLESSIKENLFPHANPSSSNISCVFNNELFIHLIPQHQNQPNKLFLLNLLNKKLSRYISVPNGLNKIYKIDDNHILLVYSKSIFLINIIDHIEDSDKGFNNNEIHIHDEVIIGSLLLDSHKHLLTWSKDNTIRVTNLKNRNTIINYVFEGVVNVKSCGENKFIAFSKNQEYKMLELENFQE
tara:strand:+ start:2111 stop:4492 length:2382 start_codon:yes stop_codon:yes gene_type:complete